MNSLPFYESFLQRHLPGWASRRAAARERTAMATYRGAVATRLSSPWSAGQWSYRGGSLTERHSLADMRDRAREVYRYNAFARALLEAETENVVGEGFRLFSRSADPDFRAEVEDRWLAFMDQADITGRYRGGSLMAAIRSSRRLDGDAALILVDANGQSKLQYVPADRITSPLGRVLDPMMIDGVEIDDAMSPRWLNIETLDANGKPDWARVQLYEPGRQAIYAAHVDYGIPLAVRGMTCFGQVFALLDQLDGYVDAVATAARLAAAIGLIFREDNPAKTMAGFPTEKNSQQKDTRVITIENGSLKFVGREGEVAQVQAQQPMSNTPQFVECLQRIAGVAFGMPLEIAARNLANVNFSGGRIGLNGWHRRCRINSAWEIASTWSPIFRWWVYREAKRGRFRSRVPDDLADPEFRAREWEHTDPQTDITALAMELSLGQIDEFTASARVGRDYEETLSRRRDARLLRERYQEPAPALSSSTRDATTKVTAVDADGNPLSSGPDGQVPLNGIQITSAIDTLTKVTEKLIEPATAIELISRLNIAPDKAKAMVMAAANRQGISAGDRDFQREVLKSLLTVPAAREAVYNATDIEDLIKQSGLPPQVGDNGEPLEVPFIPVVGPAGQLVSGGVIIDPQGDIVGGDVETDIVDAAGDGQRNGAASLQRDSSAEPGDSGQGQAGAGE